MSATPVEHDVLIVGGGPAGCAAAIHAQRLGLRTLLLDRAGAVSPRSCSAWVGPAAGQFCEESGVKLTKVGQKFAGLRLWTWDFGKSAAVTGADCGGWVVDPPALRAALLAAVRVAGAAVQQPASVTRLAAAEDGTRVELAGGLICCARVVLIAAGSGSGLLPQLSLTGGLPPPPTARGAVASFEAPASGAASLDVVLGATRAFKVATIARLRARICVTLITHDAPTPAAQQLGALLQAAEKAGVVPVGVAPTIDAIPALPGHALEFESHAGKQCLLVGDAGGFVAAFSNDGLYPALRSGQLAAETAARALEAPVLQDELASFDAAWRTDLADYLRMPNTDLALLLPMVFGNAQMARRVAQAFLRGQGF